MAFTEDHLEFFHSEPIHDRDFTIEEAVTEAKRCLHCKVPQCRKGCPIENEIPQFIHELAQGNFGTAATYLYHRSDLPALCGRVCPREEQCEGSCILGKKGKPIAIGKLERLVADIALDAKLLPVKPSKKTSGTVAIIGCGPAGMAAAQELAKRDYEVTIYEGASEPGGMLTYGIPTFRLHKELVYRETALLEKLGVTIFYNTKVGTDVDMESLCRDFDAVFIGVGAMAGWNLGVENDDIPGVVDASHYLYQIEQVQHGEASRESLPIQKGDHVIVIGAGNVAIDAARTSVRLGADVKIVYRRGEKNMKCLPSEYEEAKDDGVVFQFYSAPRAVVGTDHVEGLRYEEQEILEDATMVPTGRFGVVKANKIVAAIGNRPELDVIKKLGITCDDDGYLATRSVPYGMTSKAGVFAAGDIVHKPQTVVLAMREGRRVGQSIDEYIRAKRLMDATRE